MRIVDLAPHEPRAQAERECPKNRHPAGDGYAAAFIFALVRDVAFLPAARDRLLAYGRKGGDLGKRALEVGRKLFRVGQPGFPGSDRSLCVRFLSPQDMAFTANGKDFTVDSFGGEGWVIGFCPKGQLQGWP